MKEQTRILSGPKGIYIYGCSHLTANPFLQDLPKLELSFANLNCKVVEMCYMIHVHSACFYRLERHSCKIEAPFEKVAVQYFLVDTRVSHEVEHLVCPMPVGNPS